MDEYLKINNGLSIEQIINLYEPFDSLKINWVLFGSNNIINSKTNDKLKSTYTRSFSRIHDHVKSLTKVSNICGCNNPHYFLLNSGSIIKNILNEITVNDHHEKKMKDYRFDSVNLFLAHYVVQGINGFIIRRFGRRTANTNVFSYGNLINLINDNIDEICNFYIDNNPDHISHFSEHEKNIIRCIFNFLNSHNGNDEENILC